MAMLTRVPLPVSPGAHTGVRAYSIVGAALGGTTFLPLLVLGNAFPVAAAILAVAMLAILSGGLHLDGLADTFDALVAMGPDGAERARRDPAVGAAGATALILVIGLDVAALAQLLVTSGVFGAGLGCVVAGAVSRLVPAVLARWIGNAPDGGLGAWFVDRTSSLDAVVVVAAGVLIVLIVAALIGSPPLALGWVLAGVGSVAIGVALVHARGQLDGDLLGATVELGFGTTLLVTAVVAAGVPA
jgi:adenosylcobinamide-GDP ribazoletransferase